jgi:hypothetical protein
MHREMAERNIVHSSRDYAIYDPTHEHTKPIVGRVIARGLSDELNDRHYLIVDALDGQALYVDIGLGEKTGPMPEGSIIRITPKSVEPRQVDRTVTEIAAKNGGRYSVNLHLKYDPCASYDFAETHVRRLEAIRKVIGGARHELDGTWIIAPDHLDRAAAYERTLARQKPVIVDKLSSLSLEQQITANGATWIDRQLVSNNPEPTRDSGFGHDMRDAMKRRQQWLIEQGLAKEQQGIITYSKNMPSTLQERELSQIAGQISKQTGLRQAEMFRGCSVEGKVTKILDLVSGKFALIERSLEFVLVPWRPILEKSIGKKVSGRSIGDEISWRIDRQRGLSR